MFTKRILSTAFMAAAFAFLAACGGQANAQTIPAATGYALTDYAAFGSTKGVNLATARAVDLVSGSWKVTTGNGSEVIGVFSSPNVFFNTPAFKKYVRTNYNGGYRWWNTAAIANAECANSVTTVYWNGGTSSAYGGCDLQQVIDLYSAKY